MLHYDPLDQHNLWAGVILVYLPFLHHHHLLHHYVITSRVSNIDSILLSAYRWSTTAFQL